MSDRCIKVTRLLHGFRRATKKSRGIGYVHFAKAEDASTAMAAMDGSIFQGRLLHVLPARKAPAPVEQPEKVRIGRHLYINNLYV